MKIGKKKVVEIDAKELRIHIKVRDEFTAHVHDQNGDEIGGQDDGYVPGFMPGEHHGDYLILNIDLETGKILNWVKPSVEEIQAFVDQAAS